MQFNNTNLAGITGSGNKGKLIKSGFNQSMKRAGIVAIREQS